MRHYGNGRGTNTLETLAGSEMAHGGVVAVGTWQRDDRAARQAYTSIKYLPTPSVQPTTKHETRVYEKPIRRQLLWYTIIISTIWEKENLEALSN